MRVAGWTDKALRVALSAVHSVLRVHWLIRRPRTFGAHALALDSGAQGSCSSSSATRRAGACQAGAVASMKTLAMRCCASFARRSGSSRTGASGSAPSSSSVLTSSATSPSILVVEDVHYRPRRWSWEVEAICEAPIDALPADLAPIAAEWIDALRGKI